MPTKGFVVVMASFMTQYPIFPLSTEVRTSGRVRWEGVNMFTKMGNFAVFRFHLIENVKKCADYILGD